MSMTHIDALLVKGIISELPNDVQEKVKLCVSQIRQVMADADDGIGEMAIALIGSELAAK